MKKIRKVIQIFLLVFLISTVGILFFSKINHEIRKCAEKKELEKVIQGQYVMTKECRIFLRILGKKNADKTIVYMHGLGNSDAIVSTEPMFRELGSDYKVVVMDRPGNGLSKDTGKEQCIESIIQTYREALEMPDKKRHIYCLHIRFREYMRPIGHNIIRMRLKLLFIWMLTLQKIMSDIKMKLKKV